jgi:hypothetical protein
VAHVVGRDFGVCHVCGHTEAKSADHILPVAERPDLELTASNLKAVHGWPHPCPVCSAAAVARGGKPVYCNEIRSSMSTERARRIISERTGTRIAPGQKTEGNSGERDWG